MKRRLADFRAGVYMQTLLRDPAAGIMHSLIYFSFLILAAVTATLEVNHQLPEEKFLRAGVPGVLRRRRRGRPGPADRRGLGARAPLHRPAVPHPHQDEAEHALILGTFLALAVTGFGAECGASRSRAGRVRGVVLRLLPAVRPGRRHGQPARCPPGLVDRHVVSFLVFLAILPVTMLRHMFTSPLNMWLRDRERPRAR